MILALDRFTVVGMSLFAGLFSSGFQVFGFCSSSGAARKTRVCLPPRCGWHLG